MHIPKGILKPVYSNLPFFVESWSWIPVLNVEQVEVPTVVWLLICLMDHRKQSGQKNRSHMITAHQFPSDKPTYLPMVKHWQTKCLSLGVSPKIRFKAKRVDWWDKCFNSVHRGSRNSSVLSYMSSSTSQDRVHCSHTVCRSLHFHVIVWLHEARSSLCQQTQSTLTECDFKGYPTRHRLICILDYCACSNVPSILSPCWLISDTYLMPYWLSFVLQVQKPTWE